MTQENIIGYAVLAIITLGSFIGVVLKFTQPINDLNVTISQLQVYLKSIEKTDENQNKRIDKHGQEIDGLKDRVGKVEVRVEHLEGK